MRLKKEAKKYDFLFEKVFFIEKNIYFCGLNRIFLQNIMKKVILTFVFLSLIVFGGDVHAQERATDGFFKSNYEMYREENADWGQMPLLPDSHGYQFDYSAEAPIGSGLLLLSVMGVGYLAARKKD